MNDKKVILIGKVGKSVRLKNVEISTGGDAPMIFYSTASRMNPEYDFYFIGPNDLKKLSPDEYDYLFPNHNVFSAFERDDSLDEPFKPTVDYFKKNNIKPDFALLMCGMVSLWNVPNFGKKADGSFISILNSFKSYAGPYIYVMNELGVPYYSIAEDARYITINAQDLYNREKLIFSQINESYSPVPYIKSKTDWETTTAPIQAIYSGVERIFLMGIDKDWRSKIDLDAKINTTGEKFIIISNGCGTKEVNRAKGTKMSRLPVYKKWILENFKNTEYEGTTIYGTWDDSAYAKYPDKIKDVKLCDLQDEVAQAKYSMAYSQIPGFVTVKAWELVTMGIVPFIHPDYDKYRLLGFPEYVYVKSPEDLLAKCRELDENPDLYKKLMNECMDLIKPEYTDGTDLNNFIFGRIAKEEGYSYEPKAGVESIFNHFNKKVFDSTKVNSEQPTIKEPKTKSVTNVKPQGYAAPLF